MTSSRRSEETDGPTAEEALTELEVLVGEWTLEAVPPGGEPWPGKAKASFEWMEGIVTPK